MVDSVNGAQGDSELKLLKFLRRRPFVVAFFVFAAMTVVHEQVKSQTPGRPAHPSRERIYAPDLWREDNIELPSPPSADAYNEVQVSNMGRSILKVDPSSVRVGNDGVVRFVYAIISSSGVANIFYEAYRCETSEYKVYATSGAYDKSWSALRKTIWRPILPQGHLNYREDLRRYYICPWGGGAQTVSKMTGALKKGKIKKVNRKREYR